MPRYKNVVWDWNGTLLNDRETGLLALNDMLTRRHQPPMTMAGYIGHFEFPVENFYRKVGFDLDHESLDSISVDFVETYDKYFAKGYDLNPGIRETLATLHEAGVRQFVLSALREDMLGQLITEYKIDRYFCGVCGTDNIYAAGKIDRGRRMVDKYGIVPTETLMIGDTTHDAEVADALGFGKLLFTGGHNDESRLRAASQVVESISDIPSIILQNH